MCRWLCGVPEDNGEDRSSTRGAPSTRLASTLPWTHHQSPFLEASPLPPSTPPVSWFHSSLDFPSFPSQLFGFDWNSYISHSSRGQRPPGGQGAKGQRTLVGGGLLRVRGGGARSPGLCFMAAGSPCCFGESEPLKWLFLASQLCPQAWCRWMVVEGQTRWKDKKLLWDSGKSQGRECNALGSGGEGCWAVREWAWFPAVRIGLLSYYYPHTADSHSVLRRVPCPLFYGLTSSCPASSRLLPGVHERMNSEI